MTYQRGDKNITAPLKGVCDLNNNLELCLDLILNKLASKNMDTSVVKLLHGVLSMTDTRHK